MLILNEKYNLQGFLTGLINADSRLLLLDYDGTLAPFVEDRNNARLYPEVEPVLEELVLSSRTRVVIVSGRCAKDFYHLLNIKKLPEIWGSHGVERISPDGRYELQDFNPEVKKLIDQAYENIVKNDLVPHCEQKAGGLALHWRGLSEIQTNKVKKHIEKHWDIFKNDSNFHLHPFDGGVEFRYSGFNKGDVVNKIIADVDVKIPIAFLGDDNTDEDAFRALSGRGLSVLVRKELKQTLADICISPPEELMEFLRLWL